MLPLLLLSPLLFASTTTAGPCKTAWKYFNQTDSCYFTGHWETFTQAEDTCTRNDGHLASVHSKEENIWIQGLYATKHGLDLTWLGLRQEKGVWRWTDGSTVDYSNWQPFPGNKSCAAQDSANFQWLTVRCGVRIHKYVCKKPAGKAIK